MSTTKLAEGTIELVSGQLYALGASIQLDGRVSWVPGELRGWQPINCYVLVEDDGVLVIDPGIYAHRRVIGEQLQSLVAAGTPMSVFVTRAECDTTGNLGEISSRFDVDKLYAGGGPNPFDAFEAITLTDRSQRSERIQMERTPAGFSIPVGASRAIEVLRPSIRLLATWWAYDKTTRTLFTSDSFTHCVQMAPSDARVIDGAARGAHPDVAAVRGHLLSKFGWLQYARTGAILAQLREVFDRHQVDRIAPSHGVIIEGQETVRHHVMAVENAIRGMS